MTMSTVHDRPAATAVPEPTANRHQPSTGSQRRGLAILAMAAFMLASVGLMTTAQPAAASATGCSGYSWYNGKPLGTYCMTLHGTGTTVNYVNGWFGGSKTVCNWDISAEFFDSNGKWYKTVRTPKRYGCMKNGAAEIRMGGFKAKRGFMCSTLRQNGSRITSVCHNIY